MCICVDESRIRILLTNALQNPNQSPIDVAEAEIQFNCLNFDCTLSQHGIRSKPTVLVQQELCTAFKIWMNFICFF